MRLVRQPHRSRLCGQCCVAMLANVPLEDVVGQIRDMSTKWTEIRAALFTFGVIAEARLEPAFHADDLPELAVIIIPTGSTLMKHAAVVQGFMVYDPAYGTYPTHRLEFATTPAHEVIKFSKVTHR